jgi:DNA-directed RNA polymerase subunit F
MWYALSLIKKEDKRITYLKRTVDYLIQVAELEQKQVKKLVELDELRSVQIGSLCDCVKKINAKGNNDEKYW